MCLDIQISTLTYYWNFLRYPKFFLYRIYIFQTDEHSTPFCQSIFLFRIPLYTLRLCLAFRYSCDSGLISFQFLHKWSRNWIDFMIPLVIHSLNLCVCLWNRTVFFRKAFIFSFLITPSKTAYVPFGSVIKLWSICSFKFTLRISFLNCSIWFSFTFRIFIYFGLCCLGCKRFMQVAPGQWSDTRDLTTTGEKVKFGLGNLQ